MEPTNYRTQVFTVTAPEDALDDAGAIRRCVERLVEAGGFTFLKTVSHSFEPTGFTMVALLAESHIAVHTWPKQTTAKIVISTCRKDSVAADLFESVMSKHLRATDITWSEVSE